MKSDLVKVLHPVAGRPMLDYVLTLAEQMGSSRIAVIIGHQAESVERTAQTGGLRLPSTSGAARPGACRAPGEGCLRRLQRGRS